jgi:hypothetical protein
MWIEKHEDSVIYEYKIDNISVFIYILSDCNAATIVIVDQATSTILHNSFIDCKSLNYDCIDYLKSQAMILLKTEKPECNINIHYISVAVDFGQALGGRYKEMGDNSGEEFRDTFLLPILQNKNDNSKIVISFDGTIGAPPGFLEETFGGLVRKGFAKELLLNRLHIISNEDEDVIPEIYEYILNASKYYNEELT